MKLVDILRLPWRPSRWVIQWTEKHSKEFSIAGIDFPPETLIFCKLSIEKKHSPGPFQYHLHLTDRIEPDEPVEDGDWDRIIRYHSDLFWFEGDGWNRYVEFLIDKLFESVRALGVRGLLDDKHFRWGEEAPITDNDSGEGAGVPGEESSEVRSGSARNPSAA